MDNKKELVVALADAEQAAVATINAIMQENGLPCYLMEPIVDKIHQLLLDGKRSELTEARNRESEVAS